jgi:hypothetical protein
MEATLRHSTKRNILLTAAAYCLSAITAISVCGCSLTGGPRARMGYLPTTSAPFPNPDRLGKHGYTFNFSEATGILYTCRGGHLDLDHVRGAADNTRWLVKRVRQTLSKGGKGFSFSLTGEWSSHQVSFTYPEDWEELPDREQIIEQIASDTGAYLAYNATLWHEILTWFDVHFVVIEPEFYSAFSWEDVYSNLVGVHCALEAMKDAGHGYDDAMTIALDRALKKLEVQPAYVARAASESVRGIWYSDNILVPETRMRNFDIGLDGFVTPTLIEGVGCDSKPLPLAVPNLDSLHEHGFSMYYEIKPNVLEQGRIFKAAGSDKIIPEQHFPVILEYMKRQAEEKGYEYDS